MTVFEIPIVSSSAHFVQEHELFAKSFFLEFEWIERARFWQLHIFNTGQEALAFGIKLIPDWPLYIHRQEKPFALMLLKKAANSELNRQNLNQAFILVAHENL